MSPNNNNSDMLKILFKHYKLPQACIQLQQ